MPFEISLSMETKKTKKIQYPPANLSIKYSDRMHKEKTVADETTLKADSAFLLTSVFVINTLIIPYPSYPFMGNKLEKAVRRFTVANPMQKLLPNKAKGSKNIIEIKLAIGPEA